jgi:hypothetical protein
MFVWRDLHGLRNRLSQTERERDSLAFAAMRTNRDIALFRRILAVSIVDSSLALSGVERGRGVRELRLASLKTPLILYTVDEDCPYCPLNFGLLNELARDRPCSVAVIAVDVGRYDPESLAWSNVEFPVLERVQGTAWGKLLTGDVTPFLMVIAPGGRVARWWYGALDTRETQAVRMLLKGMCARLEVSSK